MRDVLARGNSEEALRDASARLMDRRWMSRIVLVGVSRALEEDGVPEAVAQHPVGRALRQLSSAEGR